MQQTRRPKKLTEQQAATARSLYEAKAMTVALTWLTFRCCHVI